jgi:hypothetical protein
MSAIVRRFKDREASFYNERKKIRRKAAGNKKILLFLIFFLLSRPSLQYYLCETATDHKF